MSVRPIAFALLVAVTPAAALDVAVDAYRSAAVVRVAGRAYVEGRRPTDARVPLTDVVVTVLPRSGRMLQAFEQTRRGSRDDTRAYRRSASVLRASRRELERALADAGGGDLVRFTAVAPDGTFELDAVPAGAWVLVAERAVFVAKPGAESAKRDRELFLPAPRLKGYYTVTIWLRELTLAADQAPFVELTDRNAWMTAIEEERAPGAGP
jgi:hypothetical protein